MNLEIIELSQYFVKWRLTDLDPNYSRDDRKVQFTVYRKNENDTGYGTQLYAEIDTRDKYTIPTAKNNYGIPMSAKLKTFEHVTYFGTSQNKNLIIQPHDKLIFDAQVLYSYGPIAQSKVLEDIIGIKENSINYNFTNYPNFEIGGVQWNTDTNSNKYLLTDLITLKPEEQLNLQKKIAKIKGQYKTKISDTEEEDIVYKEFEQEVFDYIYSIQYYNYYPGPSIQKLWEKDISTTELMPEFNQYQEGFQKIASTTYQVGDHISIAENPKTAAQSVPAVDKNPKPTDIPIIDPITQEIIKEEENTQKIEIKIETVQTVSYDSNFLKPLATPIDTIGSTQYKALFPPILESYQPAFVGEQATQYEILFKLSEYSDYRDVAHVDLRITLQSDGTSVVNNKIWPDGIIYKRKDTNDITNYGNGIYGVKINTNKNQDEGIYDLKDGHWQKNTYYKVQARLGTTWKGWNTPEEYAIWRNAQAAAGKFSEWSTIMILRSISAPTVRILNNNIFEDKMTSNSQLTELSTTPIFHSIYKHEANGEILDTYQYSLQDYSTGAILEQTEWFHYPIYSLTDNSISISHRFNYNMEKDKTYRVLFNVKTANGYELGDDYIFTVIPSYLNLPDSVLKSNFSLKAVQDDQEMREEGIIKLALIYTKPQNETSVTPLNKIIGNFVITRTKKNENLWEDLDTIQIFEGTIKKSNEQTKENSDGSQILNVYTDFTAESGVEYTYGIQQTNFKDTRSQMITTKDSVSINFEHMFLYSEGKQLKLKYNPTIDSFKHTVLASKQDTLGNKYPYISRNGYVYYAEFPFKSLISFNSDENGYFMKDLEQSPQSENLEYKRDYVKNNIKYNGIHSFLQPNKDIVQQRNSTNLSDENINLERKFREEVEKFLNNGKSKLFRSATEGNFIVSLMNITFTPETSLGRMIYSVSGTAYEIAECNIENLKKYSILNSGRYQRIHDTSGVYGQIAGVFDSSVNLVDEIRKEVYKYYDNPSIEEVLQYIEELKIMPYPKKDITNNILLAEAKKYDDNNSLGQYKDKNGYNIDYLKRLQTLLNTYSTYVPMNINFNSNNITLLPDTPYVLTDQKITLSDNIHFNKLREKTQYEQAEIYQPALVEFYAYKTIQENVHREIVGSYKHVGFNQLSGYFYDTDDKNCPYFYGNEMISNNLGVNYYHSLNIIEIIKEQIYEELQSLYPGKFLIDNINNKIIIKIGEYISEIIALDNIIIEVPQNMQLINENGDIQTITPQGIQIPELLLDQNTRLNLEHMTYATITYDYTVAIIKYAEGDAEVNEK